MFGVGPALRTTRFGAGAGASRFRDSKVIVAGPVALSLMALAGTGLFLGTLRNLLNVDTGFPPTPRRTGSATVAFQPVRSAASSFHGAPP